MDYTKSRVKIRLTLVRVAIPIFVLFTAACTSPVPKPGRSDQIATIGGGFISNLEKQETRYALSYELLKAYPEQTFIVVEFENPQEANHPLRTEKSVTPGLTRLDVQSPPVYGLRVGTNYRVVLHWYSDQSRTKQLSELHQLVQWIGFRGLPVRVNPALRQ